MSTGASSTLSAATTWLALLLVVVLLVLGVSWYGVSLDVHRRFWADIAERLHGPMTFRFVLQPAMALLAAIPDGWRDARAGHKSFFWSALWDHDAPTGRLREGFSSIARVILLGIGMDVIYQLKVLDRFYPVEAVVMVLLLAIVPYFVFRWIIEWVARRWLVHNGSAA